VNSLSAAKGNDMNIVNQRIESLIQEIKSHERDSLMFFRIAAFFFIVGFYLIYDNKSTYALATFAMGLGFQVGAAKEGVFAEIAKMRFDQALHLENPFENTSERFGDLLSGMIDDLKAIKKNFSQDRE
jgi:ABC-type multidrug transport system fused ATPase/permease subunit